ncbi:hypothetical protein [Scleromatobacter humisilvae]|uniref:Curli production assembly/transport component CsgG n=1 Tax=Scleromatobacter humisilvae TaxID=2897159 RepID=A0A9X1YGR1_9BURK|nr:hypothetical protein [Scleromatobacter humisilvae]MCK9685748.1 hypothetical protein [Scleromatobacter humisilvae]
MSLRFLLGLAAILPALASPAHAQAPQAPTSYAVISLVGDRLDVVTYQPKIGTLMDANSHSVLRFSEDLLDTVALRAVNRAMKATLPGADVALLAATEPSTFADQSAFFEGDHVKLPREVAEAVHRENVATLVLLTKHRGEAKLTVSDGYLGGGKLEGLGFYIDSNMPMESADKQHHSYGFIAPFVYVDVSLVDVASGRLLRQTTIKATETIMSADNPQGADSWGAMTAKEKVAALSGMLSENLAAAIPHLVDPSRPERHAD